MTLKVNEIFYSIQGESIHAGLPCVFVRLTGCNLRCHYCDTRYAYHAGSDLHVGKIIDQVRTFECNLVEITGGEPLLQKRTPDLVNALIGDGCQVLMETNGSTDISRVDSRCIRIMDIKCPSSGEHTKTDWANLGKLSTHDQVKFVVGDRHDFDFAQETVSRLPVSFPLDQVLFSPQTGKLRPQMLADWILNAHLPARMQIQLHKVIWPDQDRGV